MLTRIIKFFSIGLIYNRYKRLSRSKKFLFLITLALLVRGGIALHSDLRYTERFLRVQAAYFKSWAFAEGVLNHKQTPTDFLADLAGDDYELLNQIIICESGWNPTAKNSIPPHAKGLFQFMPVTWSGYGTGNILDPYDNIRAGVNLYKAEGTRPWAASQSCWRNKN